MECDVADDETSAVRIRQVWKGGREIWIYLRFHHARRWRDALWNRFLRWRTPEYDILYHAIRRDSGPLEYNPWELSSCCCMPVHRYSQGDEDPSFERVRWMLWASSVNLVQEDIQRSSRNDNEYFSFSIQLCARAALKKIHRNSKNARVDHARRKERGTAGSCPYELDHAIDYVTKPCSKALQIILIPFT